MITAKRKTELIQMANRYADTAIEVSPRQASKDFYKDYCNGRMDCYEHIAVMCLTQKYINCKCGALSRNDCAKEQAKILREFFEDAER